MLVIEIDAASIRWGPGIGNVRNLPSPSPLLFSIQYILFSTVAMRRPSELSSGIYKSWPATLSTQHFCNSKHSDKLLIGLSHGDRLSASSSFIAGCSAVRALIFDSHHLRALIRWRRLDVTPALHCLPLPSQTPLSNFRSSLWECQ